VLTSVVALAPLVQPRDASATRALELLTWPADLYLASVLLWDEQYRLTGIEGSAWPFNTIVDWR
jgi:hypothetical protein